MKTPFLITNHIFSLFYKYGSNQYDGEQITQLQHMCQAAEIAEAKGFDNEIILSAFLHDIGHLCAVEDKQKSMNGFGVVDHEKIGAAFLQENGFSDRLINLVKNHVNAKRYLTFKNPEYFRQLSLASKQTLIFQGGKMDEKEALMFENNPLHKIIIALRLIDEEAKDVNKPIANLQKYRILIETHLEQQLN